MKTLLALFAACAFVSVARSAPSPIYLQQFKAGTNSVPGFVDLQQFITRQNYFDAVSKEDSFDTTSKLQQFKAAAGSAPGLVDLQQFITRQNRLDAVSNEDSLDTSSQQFKAAAGSVPGLVDLQQFITRQNRLDAVSNEDSLDTTSQQFKAAASSAPGLVDLQQFITWQDRLDAVSNEDPFDTISSNQDMVTLEQFKNHRGIADQVSAQQKPFQDESFGEQESANNMATHKKRYNSKISAEMAADDSAALFQALRLAAEEAMPEQTREQFWRAVIDNVMAQQG